MTELYTTALEVQRLCESHGWSFCIIGGLAAQRWGEPRLTRDVDLTLLTGLGGEEKFIEIWAREYQFRPPDSMEMALKSRVLLLVNRRGSPVDVALGGLISSSEPFSAVPFGTSRKARCALAPPRICWRIKFLPDGTGIGWTWTACLPANSESWIWRSSAANSNRCSPCRNSRTSWSAWSKKSGSMTVRSPRCRRRDRNPDPPVAVVSIHRPW
jgi:hypothetical protein